MEIKLYKKVPIQKTIGISLDLITEKFKIFVEDFICATCEKLVIDPLFCKICNVMICKICFENLKSQDNCPKCKKAGEICVAPTFNLNILSKFILKCPHKECDKTINYSKFNLHVDNCEFSLNYCLACNYQDSRAKVEKHIKKCELIIINCEFCEEKMTRKNYNYHALSCNQKLILCIICNKMIEKSVYLSHNFGDCFKIICDAYPSSKGFLNL